MKIVDRLSRSIMAMVIALILCNAALAQDNSAANSFTAAQKNGNVAESKDENKDLKSAPVESAPIESDAKLDGNDASDKVLRVDSELVVIDVSVLDKNRNFVAGLDKNHFQLYEDQVQQQIEVFSKERVPVSFGILIDTSGSMRFKLKSVIAAAKDLVKMCQVNDEVFIMEMKDSQRIRIVQPYTSNIEEATRALDRLYPSGGTALMDGISNAAKFTKEHASNRRRALVVMSDGDERDSLLKKDELLDQLKEEDVQVYLMGFPDGLVGNDGAFMESTPGKAKNLLKKIAEESGGQAFFPQSLTEIAPLASKIGDELRAQYTIGYYPTNDKRDGQWHRLHVKLGEAKSKYSVRTRSGYYAGK